MSETRGWYRALGDLAGSMGTLQISDHYLGFAAIQWKLISKDTPPRVKPLLYVYRVLLTGIHLMQTGYVEANLVTLNEQAELTYFKDLIAQKLVGRDG